MNLDFLEIGTSDFNTLLQSTSNKNINGMSIEPVKFYLNNLPNKDNIIKVNAAISNYDGYINVYYIKLEDIKKYDLPNYVRGCNSVNNYHPTVVELLKKRNIDPIDVYNKETVVVMTFKTLIEKYSILNINQLKIDTEGHDHIILNDYIDYCINNPSLWANKIIFESNRLIDSQIIDNLIDRFIKNDYKLIKRDIDTILHKCN